MNIRDTIALSFRTVRGNALRTGLTVAIIAFGIMALVGIVTAIKAVNQKFTDSFSTMGANAFTVRFKERSIHFGGDRNDIKVSKKDGRKEKKSNLGRIITKDEAVAFVKNYHFPAIKSISIFASRESVIAYQSRKTSPNVFLFGGDENYLLLNGFAVAYGRNINSLDVETARDVCLLGYDVAKKLFGENIERCVNAVIRINNIPYRVLGVMESRGSTFGFSRDNVVIITYSNADRNFPSQFSFVVAVMTNDLRQVDNAMDEAEGVFRPIRKLSTIEEDNFVLDRSDSVAEKAMNTLGFLTVSVMVIGFITLIGSAIALMNIMLVSVSERTREVGLIKAIGGKGNAVRLQFLLESVIISLLGALFGIALGVMVGNIASVLLGTSFVVPWGWVIYGIIICSIVGLAAGLYPAWKAGRLNPIEALRYE